MTGSWRDRAGCRGTDPELFFPLATHRTASAEQRNAQVRDAKSWCDRCPVTAECLEDAIAVKDEWAIRGGLTAAERKDRTRAHHRAAKQRSAREFAAAIGNLPPAAWSAIADADGRGNLPAGVATETKRALLAAGVATQHFSAHQNAQRIRLNELGLALAQHRPVVVNSR